MLPTFLLFSSILHSITSIAMAEDTTDNSVPTHTLSLQAPVTAEVFVDNIATCQTPCAVPLPAGKHTVRISADGYNPFVRKVTLNKDTTLQAEFEVGGGTIEFQTSIKPATLKLDGKQLVLPIRLETLEPGTYDWEVSSIGYETEKGQLNFVAGQNIFIYTELESSAGKVTIESQPSGATVFLDGNNIGVTPLYLENIELGEHSVVLEHKKYATVLRSMDTTTGNKGVVKANLQKLGAKVVFKTGDKNAEVFIANHSIGTGRRVTIPSISSGSYDVRITSTGNKTLQSTIRVPADGKVVYVGDFVKTEESGVPELTQRRSKGSVNWGLWGGVAAGSLVSAGASYFIVQALQPEPAPTGDTVVTLP